jgi:hypothetical protein
MTVAIGCAVGARCCSILLIVALPRGAMHFAGVEIAGLLLTLYGCVYDVD